MTRKFNPDPRLFDPLVTTARDLRVRAEVKENQRKIDEENMKAKIKVEKEIEIKTVRIAVAVRYDEEDIPNDFPLRNGDMWTADVEIDTGQIQNWPQGRVEHLYMKVCDEGSYTLFGESGERVAELENEYVPRGLVPGQYGDYIDLVIDANGIITNWPKKPDLSEFFSSGED